ELLPRSWRSFRSRRRRSAGWRERRCGIRPAQDRLCQCRAILIEIGTFDDDVVRTRGAFVPALAAVVVLVAGCGSRRPDASDQPPRAAARTRAAKTAHVVSTTTIDTFNGGPFVYRTRGTVSLTGRHGRLKEDAINTIYDGDVEYANLGSPLPSNRWLRSRL